MRTLTTLIDMHGMYGCIDIDLNFTNRESPKLNNQFLYWIKSSCLKECDRCQFNSSVNNKWQLTEYWPCREIAVLFWVQWYFSNRPSSIFGTHMYFDIMKVCPKEIHFSVLTYLVITERSVSPSSASNTACNWNNNKGEVGVNSCVIDIPIPIFGLCSTCVDISDEHRLTKHLTFTQILYSCQFCINNFNTTSLNCVWTKQEKGIHWFDNC